MAGGELLAANKILFEEGGSIARKQPGLCPSEVLGQVLGIGLQGLLEIKDKHRRRVPQ